MRGTRTLEETERAVGQHLSGLTLDLAAMAALQNLHRAAAAVRPKNCTKSKSLIAKPMTVLKISYWCRY